METLNQLLDLKDPGAINYLHLQGVYVIHHIQSLFKVGFFSSSFFSVRKDTCSLSWSHIHFFGSHGHACMVVGFTTTYAISAYHH
jgi:hypothetical protein